MNQRTVLSTLCILVILSQGIQSKSKSWKTSNDDSTTVKHSHSEDVESTSGSASTSWKESSTLASIGKAIAKALKNSSKSSSSSESCPIPWYHQFSYLHCNPRKSNCKCVRSCRKSCPEITRSYKHMFKSFKARKECLEKCNKKCKKGSDNGVCQLIKKCT